MHSACSLGIFPFILQKQRFFTGLQILNRKLEPFKIVPIWAMFHGESFDRKTTRLGSIGSNKRSTNISINEIQGNRTISYKYKPLTTWKRDRRSFQMKRLRPQHQTRVGPRPRVQCMYPSLSDLLVPSKSPPKLATAHDAITVHVHAAHTRNLVFICRWINPAMYVTQEECRFSLCMRWTFRFKSGQHSLSKTATRCRGFQNDYHSWKA